MTNPSRPALSPSAVAICWTLLATFLFSVMFSLPKFAGGLADPLQATWLRYFGGALIVVLISLFRLQHSRREDKRLSPHQGATARPGTNMPQSLEQILKTLPFHIARAIAGIGTVACAVYAVTQIPLGTAVAIGQTNGAFLLLIAAVFLREKMSFLLVFAGMISLAGGVVAAEPDFTNTAQFLSPGAWVAFAGAAFWGCETSLLKYTAARDHPMWILLMVNSSAMLMTLIPALYFWQELPWAVLGIYALMGPIAITGQFCNIRAYTLVPASFLVSVKYLGLVFSALIGIVFFDEIPSLSLIIGAAMIIFGGWLTLRTNKTTDIAKERSA